MALQRVQRRNAFRIALSNVIDVMAEDGITWDPPEDASPSA